MQAPETLLGLPAPHPSDATSLCTRLQKGSSFCLYHGSGHITPYGPQQHPQCLTLDTHLPRLPEWSSHNITLISVSFLHKNTHQRMKGRLLSAVSGTPHNQDRPTRLLSHLLQAPHGPPHGSRHRLDPVLQLHRTHHHPQQVPPRGRGLCRPSARVPSSSILIPIPASSKPIPEAPFK